MVTAIVQDDRIRVSLADEGQREEIYKLRHEVYARELSQHPVNASRALRDDLDGHNIYIAASVEGELCGFVSITPPPSRFSIDKYFPRASLPIELDEHVYEVRLLTVAEGWRGGAAAGTLMWAALRWVESRGGRRIVAIGRREVLEMYRKAGMEPLGVETRSGAVRFELMTGEIEPLRRWVMSQYGERLRKIESRVDWKLDLPFYPLSPCYHGGAFFEEIGPRFSDLHRARGVINADVLDAWFDPSPRVVESLREHLPWLLRTSPPTGCEGMAAVVAESAGVAPVNVLCGGGSSDLIFLALRAWLRPESRVLILDPMYGEYAHVLEKVIGCRVDRFTLRREDRYDVDMEALVERIGRGYDMVILVNPNSPTGRFVDRVEMQRLLEKVPHSTRVWIDETYIEYIGRAQSQSRFAVESDNVVICKSMSKVFALSGARAAYLLGPKALIEPLRAVSPPWAVSLPAQLAAVRALEDPEYYDCCYQRTHELREELANGLRKIGLDVVDGVANFLLCNLPPSGPTAKELVTLCREKRLFIRDISSMGSNLGDRAVRIAVKDTVTNKKMVEIIRASLVS